MTDRSPGDLRALRPLPSRSTGTPSHLRGIVAEGVESGCTILIDDAGVVLANLTGFDRTEFPPGSTVDVSGVFDPDLMSTCQQGPLFRVAGVQLI